MDYTPPGPSVHGILQARILEWVAISFSSVEIKKKKKKAFLSHIDVVVTRALS